MHPFPIALDGVATGVVSRLAGGDAPASLRLGLAMVALQASIGALNDLADADTDRGRKPGKPIPAGQVSPAVARSVMVMAAAIGLLLAVPSGPGLVALGGLGLAIGYAYDLLAKGTAWSWLPFAIGTPLLPVFGWYGAAGSLPSVFALLVPAGIVAGAALAIANARADLERDAASGVDSVAIRLGSQRAWLAGAAMLAIVASAAFGSLWQAAAPTVALGASALAVALLAVGVAIGRSGSAVQRERAWEIQAVAVALLAVAWLWGVASAA